MNTLREAAQQALEQPEQPEQPEQEQAEQELKPLNGLTKEEALAWARGLRADSPEMEGMVKGALYTHPPRRETEPAFDALVAISLLTHLGGEVADYEDVVEAVRRLHALNGELLEVAKLALRMGVYGGVSPSTVEDAARAAIAKAEGKV
jgi:hypothetical protein